MRKFVYVSFILFIILGACKRKDPVNTQRLDGYIQFTDSLHERLTASYTFTINGIYKIIDDTLLADTLAKMVVLPDTLLFYELLQRHIAQLDELYYQAQQEIYFTQDQLKGLKEDGIENGISEIQFEMQLESNRAMIELLKELVDSNILVVKSISDDLFLHSIDTIP